MRSARQGEDIPNLDYPELKPGARFLSLLGKVDRGGSSIMDASVLLVKALGGECNVVDLPQL